MSAASQLTPDGALDPQPGVRRDAAPSHRRHHHRARHVPRRRTSETLRAAFDRCRRCLVAVLMLGIETSCDETAAAVVEETGDPRGRGRSARTSSRRRSPIHREWGGVVPELASRQHIRDICGVVERALAEAGARWSDLGAIAVTQGPGLVGSLLVGVSFAKAAAAAAGVPLVGGASPGRPHRVAGAAERRAAAAGGRAGRVGRTHQPVSDRASRRLSAAQPHPRRCGGGGVRQGGEAARAGLSGRAGRSIAWPAAGNDRAVALPTTRLTHADRNAPQLKGDLDFSFSGLKTAVLRHVRDRQAARIAGAFSEQEIADICASFQRVVVDRADRADVRRGAPLRRAEHRHRRRRVGEQPAARRAASSTATRARFRRFCRACRSRPTTPR